ncbi:hypothetical protein Hokovirus_1_288 [Hokovirus HKV1]|uniref:Uncharacterized protein n=1 Tax=Hokovirus HKV1 TaxID=1977638 RepID=A0A1V0SFA7_9VIRU|nr:hypothetical protein Hokovirus_1_288 [Hokovirus HKV1]
MDFKTDLESDLMTNLVINLTTDLETDLEINLETTDSGIDTEFAIAYDFDDESIDSSIITHTDMALNRLYVKNNENICKYCCKSLINHIDNNDLVYNLLYNYFKKNIDKILDNYHLLKNKQVYDMVIKHSFFNKQSNKDKNIKIFKRLCEIMNDINYYTDFNIHYNITDYYDRFFVKCILLTCFNYDINKPKNNSEQLFTSVFNKLFNINMNNIYYHYKTFATCSLYKLPRKYLNFSRSFCYNNEQDVKDEVLKIKNILSNNNLIKYIYNKAQFQKNVDYYLDDILSSNEKVYFNCYELFFINLFCKNDNKIKKIFLKNLNFIFKTCFLDNIYNYLEFYIINFNIIVKGKIFNAIAKIYANCKYECNKPSYVEQIQTFLIKYTNIKDYMELNKIILNIYPKPILSKDDKRIRKIIKCKLAKIYKRKLKRDEENAKLIETMWNKD